MRIELRNDSVVLDGYVNAVDRDSRPIPSTLGKFIERMVPGVFKRALLRTKNVDLLLDHNKKIGSTSEKNLVLREDNIGLRATCTITDKDVIEKARNKQLRGWSFGFKPLKQTLENAGNGMQRRNVEDIELLEVSIIDNNMLPCYIGTSIEQRADNTDITTETRRCDFEPDYIDNTIEMRSEEKSKSYDNSLYKQKLQILNLKNI